MSIEMRGVTASYPSADRGRYQLDATDRPALHEFSLSVAPGEVVGIVGPNGAGKSTALRVLTRRLAPSSGEVDIDGRPLAAFGRFELARSLALVAQAPVVPAGFLVREVVEMGRTPHLGLFQAPGVADEGVVEAALTATDTLRFAERRADSLSGGELQRVVFARALAQRPRYLLLDEPTNHLDLRYQVELLAYARAQVGQGVGVLVVLHDLNLAARSCDRLVVLDAGRKVAEGAPAEVLNRRLLEAVYGARVDVLNDGGTPVVVPRFGA